MMEGCATAAGNSTRELAALVHRALARCRLRVVQAETAQETGHQAESAISPARSAALLAVDKGGRDEVASAILRSGCGATDEGPNGGTYGVTIFLPVHLDDHLAHGTFRQASEGFG